MSEHALTRRGFLASTAAVGALTATVGLAGCAPAGRSETSSGAKVVHTACGGCYSKCGYTIRVNNNQIVNIEGDAMNPNAGGKLCARGYGYAQLAFSPDRLTKPLKRDASGKFSAISWDTALQEIGEKLRQIVDHDGPQAIALVRDVRAMATLYGNRFMNALGSANIYNHGAACYLSRCSGTAAVTGMSEWTSDVAHSKMTLFIGRSYADGIRPQRVQALQQASEAGAKLVLVDPRLNNSGTFATEWVPIKPGTDMALVLAISQVLVANGLYDKNYVEANVQGFNEWWSYTCKCTPAWAEEICGVPADDIERLAAELAQAAPACSVEPSWRAAFGAAYANSGETARAVAILNTLLGCWNQRGGACFYTSPDEGKVEANWLKPVEKPKASRYGADEVPLAAEGDVLMAAEGARRGDIKGMIFYASNMVAGYQNPKYLGECLDNLDLYVVIDVLMTETAQHAHYILPECTYLERTEIPDFWADEVPFATMRFQALDRIHPETRSCDEIFKGLAEACGIGDYFNFTVEQYADAQLKSIGHSLDEMRTQGTITFPQLAFEYGTPVKWETDQGKVLFANPAVKEGGWPAVPQWSEPAVMPEDGQLRLISGKQAVQSHSQTTDVKALFQISKQYDLERVWINPQVASKLGIKDGDMVELSNQQATGRVRAKVTERMSPWAVFMASHYGVKPKEQTIASGFGLAYNDFTPFMIEKGYGGACIQETCVTLKKVSG